MRLARRHKLWGLLTATIAALLVVAAPAAAEVRTGSATSPADPGIPGEADILSGGATYDTSTGTLTVTFTTREAPGTSGVILAGGGVGVESGEECGYPLDAAAAVSNEPFAQGLFLESEEEFEEGVTPELGQKSVSGYTTTLTFTSSRRPARPFDCAYIETVGIAEEGEELDEVTFPVSAVEMPPPTNTNEPPPSNPGPSPTPPPASGETAPAKPTPAPALAFGKSKAVKAKPGKWTKVKVQLSNPGTGATGPVALKVKAPVGVKLKPGSGKLSAPALGPGKSETVTFKVKLTEKAKAKSKLSLTATSGSLSAKVSVVVKRQG